MRDITSYSREEIIRGMDEIAGSTNDYGIKIMFSPVRINEENFGQVSHLFSHLATSNYDTVVILESVNQQLKKKIPMPSADEFRTKLGPVLVNDRLRNEFCDEEDDFFIDDSAYHENMSLFSQLVMLQSTLGQFNVLSMQISEYESAIIVNELVLVLDELLMSRNVLLLICCDMAIDQKERLQRLKQLVISNDKSNLLHLVNRHSFKINGKTAFLVGLLVSTSWNVDLHFLNDQYSRKKGNSLIAGFASLKNDTGHR